MQNLKGNNLPTDLIQVHRMALAGFLIRGLSHELNNPLTAIAGFSEGLLKRLKKMEDGATPSLLGTFGEYLEIINDEAFRCQEIISKLKGFSTASSDTREPVRVEKAVTEALALMGQAAKDNGIGIGFASPLSEEQVWTQGNGPELTHLFMTLFKILLLESSSQGRYQVTCENTGASIRIDIPDPKGRFEGLPMDLDLSVCYTIARHHGGEIKSCGPKAEGHPLVEVLIPTCQP